MRVQNGVFFFENPEILQKLGGFGGQKTHLKVWILGFSMRYSIFVNPKFNKYPI